MRSVNFYIVGASLAEPRAQMFHGVERFRVRETVSQHRTRKQCLHSSRVAL